MSPHSPEPESVFASRCLAEVGGCRIQSIGQTHSKFYRESIWMLRIQDRFWRNRQ